jgi:hypothetical protein
MFRWHASLFPTGRSGMRRITVGGWRNDSNGPINNVLEIDPVLKGHRASGVRDHSAIR